MRITVALDPRSLDIQEGPLGGCLMCLDVRLVRGASPIRIYRWDSITVTRTVGLREAMMPRTRDTALERMPRRRVVRVL